MKMKQDYHNKVYMTGATNTNGKVSTLSKRLNNFLTDAEISLLMVVTGYLTLLISMYSIPLETKENYKNLCGGNSGLLD